jgi:hypothetical protein
MQLVRHLKDEELTELLLDGDQQELQHTLGALPNWLRTAADRPEWFWQRQQAAIRSRMAPAKHARVRPAVAGASALALTLLALLLLNSGPAPKPTLVQTDSDQELMMAVEEAVHGEVPSALEPATLLAEEINNSMRTAATKHRSSQETAHEN